MIRLSVFACGLLAATGALAQAVDGGVAPPDLGPAALADLPPPSPDAAPPPPPPSPPPVPAKRGTLVTPTVEVVGRGARALDHVPGSASVVKREDIRQLAPTSAVDVLRTISGINAVAEDPSGLRINIGIRGLDPNRSRKVLILEDGAPVALNPYGLPEAYYGPPIERMDRVEVVKGSGAILWGPQTIGGVLNYITPDPSRKLTVKADLRYGNYGYLVAQAAASNTHGAFGYRLDVLHRRFDWRNLDLGLTDVTAKFRIQLNPRSTLAIKLNFYDERSSSTYLGLTTPQFAEDPNAQNARYDRFTIRRYALWMNHTHLFTDHVALRTTLYAYQTNRSWRRQDYDRADLGFSYERAVPGERGGVAADDGSTIFFRNTTGNRQRAYEVFGIEPRVSWSYTKGPLLAGELIAGVRYHFEQAHDRLIQGLYPQDSSGDVLGDEVRHGHAFSAYLQNRFTILDRLRITPGVRLETYRPDKTVYRTHTLDGGGLPRVESTNSYGRSFSWAVIPGLGLSFDPHPLVTLYAGVHRGYAPPRSKDAVTPSGVDLQLSPEGSWNSELGVRARVGRWLNLDVAAFWLEFTNQIIPPSEAGGAAGADGSTVNSGRSRHVGLEASTTFDVASLLRQEGFALPLIVTYTYLPIADFTGGVYEGYRLPYAPEHLLNAQLRFEHKSGFAGMFGVTHVGGQFADKDNTQAPSLDGLLGELPSYTLLDARLAYTVKRIGLTLYVSGKNLANAKYISSRAPAGIMPGTPLTVFGGLSFEWPPRSP